MPFVRDMALSVGWTATAALLEAGWVRLTISLALLWAAAAVNLRGVVLYERLMVPLMYLTFVLAAVVIVAGFSYDHADFASAVVGRGESPAMVITVQPGVWTFLSASSVLFASFIGFDSIAQAGGEAKNPGRNLPLAIGLAVGSVGILYILFTAAVYHAVPWQYIAIEAQRRDMTAPGLLGALLPPFWTVVIISAAAIALAKDLPAMLLAVSRLMFAWAGDGIFPRAIASVHPTFRTPHVAIVASAAMATLGVIGSHLAGDFFLGVDILVSSMLVNFLLMALSVLTLPRRNPRLASAVTVLPAASIRTAVGAAGIVVLATFLAVHTWKDLTGTAAAWYFRSTPLWLMVMAVGSFVYMNQVRGLRRAGVDLAARFSSLPAE
jgi:amino acid transporter